MWKNEKEMFVVLVVANHEASYIPWSNTKLGGNARLSLSGVTQPVCLSTTTTTTLKYNSFLALFHIATNYYSHKTLLIWLLITHISVMDMKFSL